MPTVSRKAKAHVLCEGCHTPFQQRFGRERFCSLPCYREQQRTLLPEPIPCACCQTLFRPTSGKRNFCSRACYAFAAKPEPVICAGCQVLFQAQTASALFCSRSCYRAHRACHAIKHESVACGHCHVIFQPEAERVLFCSTPCYMAHRASNRKPATYFTSRAYRTWSAMKQRCFNPNNVNWKNYGAKGITVCDRWLIFENFLADMGEPGPGQSLDRFPNNVGNYEPGNCRWATAKQQARNRRDTVLEEHEPAQIRWLFELGYKQKEIAAFFGVCASTISNVTGNLTWM